MYEVLSLVDQIITILEDEREEFLTQALSDTRTPNESLYFLEKVKKRQRLLGHVDGFLELIRDQREDSDLESEEVLEHTQEVSPEVETDTELVIPEPPALPNRNQGILFEAPKTIKEYWPDIRQDILNQLSDGHPKTSPRVIDEALGVFHPHESPWSGPTMRKAVSSRIRRLKEEGLIETVEGTSKVLQLSEQGKVAVGLESPSQEEPTTQEVDPEEQEKMANAVTQQLTAKFRPLEDPTLFGAHS